MSELEKAALERLGSGEKLSGKDGAIAPLIKRLIDLYLEGELQGHLEEERAKGSANRRNGRTAKALRTEYGEIEIEGGRDRAGTFEPQIVKKRQTVLGKGLDGQIISTYAKGMGYGDIQGHLEGLYGLGMSKGKLSAVTDLVKPELDAWRQRELEPVYPIVWMDCIRYKVREGGRTVSRAVYCILGIDCRGNKDLLGLYTSENEGAKFWLQVLTDLKNRGVGDILIACIDNLTGFVQAIGSIFPKTEVQLCIVHQIRNSLKYVSGKDQKAFLRDLKKVYRATAKSIAEDMLDGLDAKWGEKYPVVIMSWRNNWEEPGQYFKYAPDIRRIIYTTNTVEGFNRQLRKVTGAKGVFPSEDALMKMVFLAARDIMKKWTSTVSNWALSAQQLKIHFGDRMRLDLNMGG
ncbi:MAG TPA: IS256 family transposase [Bacteroidetes bacterium]|nr:IS256 family transposase [Bacteroidota bacterium]